MENLPLKSCSACVKRQRSPFPSLESGIKEDEISVDLISLVLEKDLGARQSRDIWERSPSGQ